VNIAYEGTVSEINTGPLTQILISNLLKPQLETVNMVNALQAAKARGVEISETKAGTAKDFRSLITITVTTTERTRTLAGTLFTGKEPRIVNVEGVPIEAALSNDMLFIRNDDTPGLIGSVGTILGNAGQNIADFRLGRTAKGDSAICLIALDAPMSDALFAEVSKLPQIKTAKRLKF
jgi:D-3-phosphoglycerate dehydrogenase